jgi:hypothetical protein
MRNGFALAIGGALFALLFFSSASGGATVITSKGPRTGRASSYEGDAKRWTQARYDAAVAYLEKYWGSALTEEGIHDAALSVVAHWSLETGSGVAEYNFNVGNIHAVGSQTWFGSGDTGESGRAYTASFAAYPSIDAGVEAYFKLLENGYPSCMTKLTNAPSSADWFRCLGERGYYAKTIKGKDNLEPASKGWAARRSIVAKNVTE